MPDFPLDSVRCRFQITRLAPGYRNHFSRGSGVALPHEKVEVGRDVVRRGGTTPLMPPLHNLSVHHSFPFFPVFPVRERGKDLPQPRPRLPFAWPRSTLSGGTHPGAAQSCRATARIVSWLTPNSAASERRLLGSARARIVDSCSTVSLRARARYLGRENPSRRDGHRGFGVGSVRISGNGMRRRRSRRIEDAEPIPVASAASRRSPAGARSPRAPGDRGGDRLGSSIARAGYRRSRSAVSQEPSPCAPARRRRCFRRLGRADDRGDQDRRCRPGRRLLRRQDPRGGGVRERPHAVGEPSVCAALPVGMLGRPRRRGRRRPWRRPGRRPATRVPPPPARPRSPSTAPRAATEALSCSPAPPLGACGTELPPSAGGAAADRRRWEAPG